VSEAHQLTLRLNGEPNAQVTFGLAAAVARDGYFLTAAHLVGDPLGYLVFDDGKRMRLEQARAVAVQSDPKTHIDFAVLHVEAQLEQVFMLSPTAPELHSEAMGVGLRKRASPVDLHLTAEAAFLAGRITYSNSSADGSRVLWTDMPTREGDSGGPLLDGEGRLLGVHSATGRTLMGRQIAMATCPAERWLNEVLERDRQGEHMLPAPPPRLAADAESPLITFHVGE
jgi:S1-C subfamily serine protease